VEITSEREVSKWAEDLRIRRVLAMQQLVLSRVVWREARQCGISGVSEQACCFLRLRLDTRWGVNDWGRGRSRDDRDTLA